MLSVPTSAATGLLNTLTTGRPWIREEWRTVSGSHHAPKFMITPTTLPLYTPIRYENLFDEGHEWRITANLELL